MKFIFELYPLTFEEYEQMKAYYGKAASPNSMEELNCYVLEGGFPRTLLLDSIDAKRTYVQGIVRESRAANGANWLVFVVNN